MKAFVYFQAAGSECSTLRETTANMYERVRSNIEFAIPEFMCIQSKDNYKIFYKLFSFLTDINII